MTSNSASHQNVMFAFTIGAVKSNAAPGRFVYTWITGITIGKFVYGKRYSSPQIRCCSIRSCRIKVTSRVYTTTKLKNSKWVSARPYDQCFNFATC